MSEDEIINIIYDICIYKGDNELSDKEYQALQGILDLYNKEKEKNKELEKLNDIVFDLLNELNDKIEKDYVSKDKIREQLNALDNMKVDGEVFTTAVNFAKKILQELLEERN